MRTIKHIFISAALLTGFASCDLNEFPKDSISPDTFFHTESELELYTNQFYLMEPTAVNLYDEPSNLIVDGLSQSDVVVGLTRTVPSSGGGWSWSYLRYINYYLQNSHRCEDAAARKRYDGVAYFWRAYFYFEKLKRFGEVPWYDQVLASDQDELLAKPRDSRDVIINHIIEDCDKAAENLPASSSIYKVSRYAALALKSRACLFEGTFRKYHAGHTFNKNNLPYEANLQECVNASLDIMNDKKYSIYSTGKNPYYSLFTSENAIAQEVILARCYGGNFVHAVDAYALMPSKGMAGYTKALVFSYLMQDGSRFTDKEGWATMPFTEETKERDPRLAQTVLTQNAQYVDGTEGTFNFANTVTGYPMLKYISGPNYINASTIDVPIYRMAEVYLNYAEAKAELGTLTQDDLDHSVNLIRDRVGMPHLNKSAANADPDPFLTSELYGYKNVDSGPNKGVILEIRRERSIEMVSEGIRFADLCRWREGQLLAQPFYGPYVPGEGRYDMDGNGKIDFVVYLDRRIPAPGVTPLKINQDIFLSEGETGYILAHGQLMRAFNEDRDYLYPVPSNERTLTKGMITQNPGWNDGLDF